MPAQSRQTKWRSFIDIRCKKAHRSVSLDVKRYCSAIRARGCLLAFAFALRCRRSLRATTCAVYLNALRLGERRLRNVQAEDAILKIRVDLILIYALRQLERAREGAVSSFDDLITVILALLA